jgi:hypothetical protein
VKTKQTWIPLLILTSLMAGPTLDKVTAQTANEPGLVGGQFGSEDLTDLEDFSRLDSLEQSWNEDSGAGREWSGKWEGFVTAPATGDVTFLAETDRILRIEIAGQEVIDVKEGKQKAAVTMVKGTQYPIEVTYVHDGGSYDGYLKVRWSWTGQQPLSIDKADLFHTAEQQQRWQKLTQQAEEAEDDDDDGDRIEKGADAIAPDEDVPFEPDAAGATMPGLVGLICEKKDFREPASRDIIKHVNHNWTGGPGDWSGYWQGCLEGPYTGVVTFVAEADNGLRLRISDHAVIDGLGRGKNRTGKTYMVKGMRYPVKLWYFQDGDPSYLRLYWSWPGQDKIIVDESAFTYSPKDVKFAIGRLPEDYWDFEQAPLHFDGTGSESLDLAYQDGRVAPIVGVQNYQVFRSNRAHPELTGGLKNTYIHAPMLCYWKGRYYLEFLAAPVNEHDANTVTLMTSSVDGKNWETPRILFPAFNPYDDENLTICHQRMGFYVSKNDRLLIMAFYGKYPSPNEGDGVGRAVREVYEDGCVGPLYFIRYNRHAGYNETNTAFPYYKESPDKGFIAICDELMANKLMVQQWWEEDRSQDGFYMLSGEGFKCKAFNWYTRKDGNVVGLFKAGYTALSEDGGKSWSGIQKLPSIIVGHAKMWGQQTEDGRYALIYNPHFEWRYPLVAITSDDGRVFGTMACVHGELPVRRYEGGAKDVGPQYVRGITPGNGNPPGSDLWLAYSMNKEDIWVSRVPVPVRHTVDKYGKETFDQMTAGGVAADWNIYSAKWAPVQVAESPGRAGNALKLSDHEPYDYARAVRVFPNSKNIKVEYNLLAKQTDGGRMEVEVLSRTGARPVRIVLNDRGVVQAIRGDQTVELMEYQADRWLSFSIGVDMQASKYSVSLNGKRVLTDAAFAEKTDMPPLLRRPMLWREFRSAPESTVSSA